jgi:hypothetical protein
MLKKLLVATAMFAATSVATAVPPTLSVEDIGPNGAGLLTGNNVGIDFQVSLSGQPWLTGGFSGTASAGNFAYASDPNGIALTGTRDLAPNDEVTMVSKPRGQTAAGRFKTGGNGEIGTIPGGFTPGPLTTTGAALNASFANDAGDFTETADGYIMRVVVDLTGSGIAAGDVYAVAGTTPNNPGDTLVATGIAGAGSQGDPSDSDALANTTLWSLFAVPEPASLALLVLGGLAAFRRR